MASRILGDDQTYDPWVNHALREIYNSYGHTVSTVAKAKSLNKFGRTINADSGVKTTVGRFQGTVVNETFVTTNIIDAIISSSASDTGVIRVEGHTIDTDGNLSFSVQDVTLTGQTTKLLGTPLARASRAYVKNGTFAAPASDLVGTVSVYDNTDGDNASGVPTTAAATKLLIVAGQNQSEKCATSISSVDYWMLKEIHIGIARSGGVAVNADFEIEIKELGGVWRPVGIESNLRTATNPFATVALEPYIIVPPNTDIRMVVTTDANDTSASARMEGLLAVIE